MKTAKNLLWSTAEKGLLFRMMFLFMLVVGVLMGIAFPFFTMMVLGLPGELILRPVFVVLCLAAGLCVGFVNYSLAWVFLAVALNRLARMVQRVAGGDLSQDH